MASMILDSMLDVALPKTTVIVAQESGRLYAVDFTECPHIDDPGLIDWDASVAKLLVSKIAMSRSRLTTLEEIEFENITHTGEEPAPGQGDLGITVFATLDGKNVETSSTPYVAIDEGNYVRANCRITGKNLGIMLRGTYNINSVVVTLHQAGRR
jgi:hypothetical protein